MKEGKDASASSSLISEDYRSPLPELYYVDTGNICNLRCPFCYTGIGQKGFAKGLMSRETFDTVFDQIKPYAKTVSLFNWGEPFFNKDIVYMVSACSRAGIRSQIDSNLTLRDFSDDEAERIVESGLTQIRASIDGASQETYEKYRVGGRFDRAIENLRKLVRAKARLDTDTPSIGWSFLVNKYNEHEVDRAKQLAADIGVVIDVGLMSCWDSSWAPSLQAQSLPGDEGVTHQATFERAPLPIRVEDLALHPALHPWCKQPFNFMVINWDGRVMPCCSVYGDEYAIGDLLKETVEAVWNNSSFRASREFLYNYGPAQSTGSVCECLPCPVSKKHLMASVQPVALNVPNE